MKIVALTLLLLCDVSTEDPVCSALMYFARHQNEDGSWDRRADGCRCLNPRHLEVKVAVTPTPEARRSFETAVRSLQSDRAADRERGQREITLLGVPAVPLLQEAREHPDPEIRWRCRITLAELWDGNPDVRALFSKTTASQTADFELRSNCLILLAYLGAGYSHLSRDERTDLATGRVLRFGEVVKKGIRRLRERQNDDGSFEGGSPETQAMAALTLTEYYGMTAWKELLEPATKAVASVLALKSEDPKFLIWKGMVVRDAILSDVPHAPVDMDDLIRPLRELDSPAAVSGVVLLSALHKKRADGALEHFLKLDGEALAPADRWLAMLAATKAWKPGESKCAKWEERIREFLKPTQIGEKGCDRGSWPWNRDDHEGRVLQAAYACLSLEHGYRYSNALFR
jgi:hypothetical protein